MLIGLVVGLGATVDWWSSSWDVLALAVGATVFAALGLRDDLGGLKATTRLGAQIGLGIVFSLASVDRPTWLVGLLAVGATTTWLVLFVNAFNFMDGINGISAATTTIIASSLAVASIRWGGGIEIPALALVGASLAFAPFNAANRVFLGDVGSYLLGSMLAMLAVVGIGNGIPPVAVVLPFGLYVTDVAFTLARRASRGAPLMEAHREHVYQRLANEGGWGHERTTVLVSVCTGVLALLAQFGPGSPPMAFAGVVLAAAVLMAYLALPRTVHLRPASLRAPAARTR